MHYNVTFSFSISLDDERVNCTQSSSKITLKKLMKCFYYDANIFIRHIENRRGIEAMILFYNKSIKSWVILLYTLATDGLILHLKKNLQ